MDGRTGKYALPTKRLERIVMSNDIESRCGLYCSKCSHREKTNCPGCVKAKGEMFWGECALAKCCVEKELEHCGRCGSCPCDKLNEFSYDKDQGDNGERIRNLEKWNLQA
jgi:hypothetical protein